MNMGDNAVARGHENARKRLDAARDANSPKGELMRILNRLEGGGNKSYAKRLSLIIERLERWQNTP